MNASQNSRIPMPVRTIVSVLVAGFLVAALLLSHIVSVSAEPNIQTNTVPSITVVKLYAPFTDMGGTLSIGLAVTDKLTGSCFAASVADLFRTDAFRCMAGNRILDPCFVPNNTATVLACAAEPPWSTNVVQLTITGKLPASNKDITLNKSLPWALELANGQKCTLLTGATGEIAGLRMNYGCDGGTGISVLGDPDRTYPLWTIFLKGAKGFSADQVVVLVAWY